MIDKKRAYDFDFKGKEYHFKMGEIADEMVEECRALMKEHCKNMVEDDEIGANTNGYAIGTGAREITDEVLFEVAIYHYKEYLQEKIRERNSHIIIVKEGND